MSRLALERPQWTAVASMACLMQKLKCDSSIAAYALSPLSINGAQAVCTKDSQALSTRRVPSPFSKIVPLQCVHVCVCYAWTIRPELLLEHLSPSWNSLLSVRAP